jgi:hypothetical protein
MPHSVNDYVVIDDLELHSVVSGSQTIPTGKFSAQWLDPAHVRPILQPFQKAIHPCTHRLGKRQELFSGSCGEPYHYSIMTFYDKKANPQRRTKKEAKAVHPPEAHWKNIRRECFSKKNI